MRNNNNNKQRNTAGKNSRREALPEDKKRPALPRHGDERKALPGGRRNSQALPGRKSGAALPEHKIARALPDHKAPGALPAHKTPRALPPRDEPKALEAATPKSKKDLAGDQEIIFGIHAVEELLETKPKQIRALHVIAGSVGYAVGRLLARAKELGVSVRMDSKEAFKALAPQGNHQGIFAIVDSIEYLSLDEVLERFPADKKPLLVILDGIEDGHNLGAIIRSAHAFGASAVVTAERRSAAVSGFVAKAAAGALAHCPVARVGNLAQAMDRLIEENYTLVATTVEGGRLPWEIPWDIGPIALVIGGEHAGVRPIIKKRCHQLMTIPIAETQESLNASVAAAIALYEAAKARK